MNNEFELNGKSGKIIAIGKNKFLKHDCNTLKGYSGAPILNKNFNVIGIHFGEIKNICNTGTFINNILNHMKKKTPLSVGEKSKTKNNLKKNLQKNCKCIVISISIVVLVVLVLVVLVVIFHPFIFKFLGIGNENTDKDKTENEKEREKEKKLYIYLNEFYSIEHDQYNYKSKDYNYNKYIFNETGLFQICVFGASSINGGRGGLVCGNYSFEVNEILYYGLGGREAGGEQE